MMDGVAYSRLIAWLKILLPLAALVILSTLFLLARPSNPVATLPFAQIEIEEKLRNQGITAPYFSGQTANGDVISLTARSARPDPDTLQRITAQEVDARFTQPKGDEARFIAGQALVNTTAQTAELSQDVQITSSAGIVINTEQLTLNLLEGSAETDKIVHGKGPFGSFEAGGLRFSGANSDGKAQFLFDNGVKLIYMPDNHSR